MFAVIKTGGKQYQVAKGDRLKVEKLPGQLNKEITFEEVLLVHDQKTKIGQPQVKGATVKAKILEQGKLRKIRVFKYKNKTGYRRTQGHRQSFTRVEITAIKG